MDELKATLPDQYQVFVKKITLNFDRKFSTDLWVKVTDNQIFISPNLIKASIILVMNNSYESFRNLEEFYFSGFSEKILKTGKTNEIDGATKFIYLKRTKAIKSTLQFFIAHELAHIYLKKIFVLNQVTEEMCDCFGMASTDNKELGLFEDLLIRSLEENQTQIWGEINEKEVSQRIIALRKLPTSISFNDCLQHFKQENGK